MPYNPNREELAWAAGLFDGEGGCYSQKLRGCYKLYPICKIGQSGQTLPHVLQRFLVAIHQVGKIYPAQPPRGLSKLPVWQWRACGLEQVQAVIAMLWTFLSPDKRMQATRVLRAYRRA